MHGIYERMYISYNTWSSMLILPWMLFCVLQVHDIMTDKEALINPAHTVAITVSMEGLRTTGGVILRVHITIGTLFTISHIQKVLLQ